jgi:uncharacterized protein DUF6636
MSRGPTPTTWSGRPGGRPRAQPQQADAHAPLNDVGFILDRRHRGKRIRVTDTAADVNRARILHYGHSRRFGAFRCTSRRSGLTCRSRTSRHGFELSRQSQRLF